MKKLFLLPLAVLGALTANAEVIDGISYSLDASTKTATVTSNYSVKYTGDLVIPETVNYNGTAYSVEKIGNSAFEGATITSIVVPNSCKVIDTDAFYACTSLKTITLGTGLQEILYRAFEYCLGLTDIYCKNPDYVSVYGSSINEDMIKNVNLHLPSVAAIKNYLNQTWNQPWRGFKMVMTPDMVYSDGLYFEVNRETKTAMMVATYGVGSKFGFNQSDLSGEAQKIGPEVEIPSTVELDGEEYAVTNLEAGAFYDTPNVTSVKFNEGLLNIEFETFYGTKVTEVVFPNSLENLAYNNFYACQQVQKVTFGTEFKTIGANMFYYCPAMTDITVLATVPPTKDPKSPASDVFSEAFKQQTTLHVPEGTVDAYKASPIWGGFKAYVEIPNPNVGVEGIEAADEAPARYFNLQGVEISEPAKGEIVIEVRGNKSTKRVIR